MSVLFACRARAGSTRCSSSRHSRPAQTEYWSADAIPATVHYISGNLYARRKFALLKSLLEYVGIEPERVQFSWVSAAEGVRFAEILEKVIDAVREVGPASKMVKELEEVT